jgi:hypothetical protein
MERIKNKYEPTADNVETHLWTDAGLGRREAEA